MADPARFIFSRGIKKRIGDILVDAFSTETHTRKNVVTAYPVENGYDISDHTVNQPFVLNVNGIVEPVEDSSNILDTYNRLVQLMNDKTPVTVITGLKVYDNMSIISFEVSRNPTNGQSLVFTMQLQEIRIARSQFTEIPLSQLSQSDLETYLQSQSAVDAGKGTNGQTLETNFLEPIKRSVEDFFQSTFGEDIEL